MVRHITKFSQCVSDAEKKQRFSVFMINLCLWIALLAATVLTMGGFAVIFAVTWIITYLVAELNVRKLQARGVTVSEKQLPSIYQALTDIRTQFGVKSAIRVVVIASGETNALALKFARKRVVVILSELLEGIINEPGELRALLAHELCHHALDHGIRGIFERYKPVKYRAARELTCDNAAYAASSDVVATTRLLKRLCVGKRLHQLLSEEELIAEAQFIYSGLVGYFVRRSLTHPPAGARIENVRQFAARCATEAPGAQSALFAQPR